MKSKTLVDEKLTIPVTWSLHPDPTDPNRNAPNLKVPVFNILLWCIMVKIWYFSWPKHLIKSEGIKRVLHCSALDLLFFLSYHTNVLFSIGLEKSFWGIDTLRLCMSEAHESTWFYPVFHFVQVFTWFYPMFHFVQVFSRQQAWVLHPLSLLQQPAVALQFLSPPGILHIFTLKTLQGFPQCSKAEPVQPPVQRGQEWSKDQPFVREIWKHGLGNWQIYDRAQYKEQQYNGTKDNQRTSL